jgi:hypothetical protein
MGVDDKKCASAYAILSILGEYMHKEESEHGILLCSTKREDFFSALDIVD